MHILESTESKILVAQCVIVWATFLIAIIKFTRQSNESENSQGTAMKSKMENSARKTSSTPGAPMLTFVTADEIYDMSLETLQSVPKEHLEQLPPDKRQLVKRRINDLIQEERAKKNK